MSNRTLTPSFGLLFLFALSASACEGSGAADPPALRTAALLGDPDDPYLLSAPDTILAIDASTGVSRYVRVTVPGEHAGLRVAVRATAQVDVYVRRDAADGSIVRQSHDADLHTHFFEAEQVVAADANWWIEIHPDADCQIDVQVDTAYALALGWDDGATLTGSSAQARPAGAFGDHLYRVTTELPDFGVWRNVLRVSGGEADLFMAQNAFPQDYSSYQSQRVGSDRYHFRQNEFSANQSWYLRVRARSGDADWSIVSGDLFVEDLGPLGDVAAPHALTLDVGLGYFTTEATAQTRAWRLQAPGATLHIDDTQAPLVRDGYSLEDHRYQEQALIVPSYLQARGYLVAVVADGEASVTVDSRNHLAIDPTTLGHGSFAFTLDDSDDDGFGYRTFQVVVPVEQIGWEVTLTPTEGEVDLYVARAQIPNEYENDAMSEAVATTDALSLVPPDPNSGTFGLTNDVFYVTVRGAPPFSFTLSSDNPEITQVPFINEAPDQIVNDLAHQDRVGWRYYRVDDSEPPLGTIGWILELAEHVPGTEIAIRRNAAPSRWLRRDAGQTQQTDHVHFGSTLGFLERPNHQTDIWYIGIYQPDAPLGAFELTTRSMTATVLPFDGEGVTVGAQASGRLRYFQVTVPPEVMGWDLRVAATSGRPRMVVRAENRPETFTTTTAPYPLGYYDDWQTGYQWAPSSDFTQRPSTFVDGVSPNLDENGRFLLAGMGNPLRQGVFYVLVGDTWTTPDASTLAYTITSRAIGEGGDWSQQIETLDFEGGSATVVDLPPRAIRYYRVDVPAGEASWFVELEPTAGDAMFAVKKGGIPNLVAGVGTSDGTWPHTGNRRQRLGYELFYRYPDYDQATLAGGTYYIAVGAEGVVGALDGVVDPATTTSFTLTSHGKAPVVDSTLTLDVPLVHDEQSLRYGEQRTYRVTAPVGTANLDVRLSEVEGKPAMAIVEGPVQAAVQQSYTAAEGGHSPLDQHEQILSVPASEGVWSITVVALQDHQTVGDDDAHFDLTITASGEVELPFNGGSLAVTQDSQTWRYFKVVVPEDALGWDLRLENISEGGKPRMVIRRDEEPTHFSSSYQIQYRTSWESGEQWAPAGELTQRNQGPYDPQYGGADEYGRRVSMGMDAPLSPGTYWVGVSDTWQQQSNAPFSYEIVSRGIGEGQDGEGVDWEIQVAPLDLASGSDEKTLAPREHAYYRVEVPAGTASWDLVLEPTVGEAMLAVGFGALPNADATYYGQGGWRRQKPKYEHFYRYPDSGQGEIPAGTYYVAVAAEGQDAYLGGSYIGVGDTTFTVSSRGEQVIDSAAAPLTGTSEPITFAGQAVRFGEQKIYRFEIGEAIEAMEVRLVDATGKPHMVLGQGAIIPAPYQSEYYSAVGGESQISDDDDAITVAQPLGVYTVIVSALGPAPEGDNDATFDLVVSAVDPTLAFNGGEAVVEDQPSQTWRYFKVEVPAGALGWDVRLLDVTSGEPRMVIRRELVPEHFSTSWYLQYDTAWESGEQWAPSGELTQRHYGVYDPDTHTGEYEYGRYVSMGMGTPLTPGTYYIGVSDTYNGLSRPAMSYRLLSRGIGIGQDADEIDWAIQVQDLVFGETIEVEGVAPRDIVYYRVEVPDGLEGWAAELVPTVGEAMMAVKHERLPNAEAYVYNTSDGTGWQSGARRQKDGREWFYKLPDYPQTGAPTTPGGTWYIAVAAEGQDPESAGYIGAGPTSFTLRTYAPITVEGGLDEIVAEEPLTFTDPELEFGEIAYYRFRVPPTVEAVEVRLANRVGDPWLAATVEPPFSARLPYTTHSSYYASEHGEYPEVNAAIAAQIVGQTGDVTVAVHSPSQVSDASYDLVVTPLEVRTLAFDGGDETVTLKEKEVAFFKVEVPQDCDGVAQAGWIVTRETGDVKVTVRKDVLPGAPTGPTPLVTSARETVIVPPFLEPGTWYVAVEAQSGTVARLRTREVVEARHWVMPAAGELADVPGLDHPYFADTGVDDEGEPIINQGSGDQGTDLGEGTFIFYRVTVPADNGGLMRTRLTALSGDPDLYIRRAHAPTLTTMPYPYNQRYFDYEDTRDVSSYGHWVPADTRYGQALEPGEYWLAVYANASTVRFRLRIDVGFVEELALDGGAVTDRQVVGGDMRYFKVTWPDTSAELGQGPPLDWTLTFQESGDALVLLREEVPPGHDTVAYDPGSYSDYYLADWRRDRDAYVYGLGEMPRIEQSGATTLSMPILKPGATYWIGVFARTDVEIDLASSVSQDTLEVDGIFAYRDATLEAELAPGERRLYRVDVPAEAARYLHTATVADGVELYLSVGLVPPETSYANWSNGGYGYNSELDRPLDAPGGYVHNHPWVPDARYYLVVKNTTDATQPIQIDFDGRPGDDDSDEDGLPDGWEYRYFGYLGVGPTTDNDNDLLDNLTELGLGTSPIDKDSDDDELDDGLELIAGGDPLVQDTDQDEVCDGSDSAPDDANESGPVIRLYMRHYDQGHYGHQYGSDQHLTRLVAVFERADEPYHFIHVEGFDIEALDEVEVTLNGEPLGAVPVGGDGLGSTPVFFVIDSNELLSGSDNRLELRQKESDEPWGVRALGLMTFGETFGADPGGAYDDRHPDGFDLVMPEIPDSLIELRGFDLDTAAEVTVTVDGASWLDGLVATAEQAWTRPLQVPFVAADMGDGPYVIAVRPSADSDGTWQLRPVAQRPILSQFGTVGSYPGEDGHLREAFHFLFPQKPGQRELVLQYYLSDGREVAVDDSARGESSYVPTASHSWGDNQEHFSEATSQDTVSATRVIVDPEASGDHFAVWVRYYGPCADVDNNGVLDCLEVCDDLDGDGADAASPMCPAGDDCDDTDPDVGASLDDADCDGVATADDCDDDDASMPVGDADCDGVATADDCDDTDAGMPVGDADCDGAATADDCDDDDPLVQECSDPCVDADEDGHDAQSAECPSGDDCDDGSATSTWLAIDADCDGVPSANDCDDSNPSVTASNVGDADCDGVPSANDCDDTNPSVTSSNVGDADCDGVPSASDCDDTNPSVTSSNVGDADCDGVPSASDCNDLNPSVTSSRTGDADCDGVPSASDCNDGDPSVTTSNVGDVDCDGVATTIDCNDADPATTATRVGDLDCDGVASAVDCNDNDATMTRSRVGDADCDGVSVTIDCNDQSAAVTNTRTDDGDCDGVPKAIDCDDTSVSVKNTNVNDLDCDLVPAAWDCDDGDARVTHSRQDDRDCDLVARDLDCDDDDATVTHTRDGDADCDLVPTALDCDDQDPAVTRTREGDADCDLVPAALDCDDGDATVTHTLDGDADCDRVATALDCDDGDASVTHTREGDADCDQVATATDCDDADASVTATNVGDADCDGVGVAIDCDDGDASVTASNVGDADCDGVGAAIDCDDGDAGVTATNEGDADCDGVAAAIDCDDGDAGVTTINDGDRDCDGVPSTLDCDDGDAAETRLIPVNDRDCDGVSDPIDCAPDDGDDARSRSGDNDCDGVAAALDCDDSDASVTRTNEGDGDCDGVPSGDDCDDGDPENLRSRVGDADCDGAPTAEDCDDLDPRVIACPVCEDLDGDGHDAWSESCQRGEDCDDGDAQSTWRAIDGDCDGVPSEDDCDDDDAGSTGVAEDGDCDGVPAVDDCDDADAERGGKSGDFDCDGVADAEDNCLEVANADQADGDGDGVGDVCEACVLGEDEDGDGFVDACDTCPAVSDPEQRDRDGDGVGDACDDGDGDGVIDGADNCPIDDNADQADRDGDGVGDVCDPFETGGVAEEDAGCRGGALGYGLGALMLLLFGIGLRGRPCARARGAHACRRRSP